MERWGAKIKLEEVKIKNKWEKRNKIIDDTLLSRVTGTKNKGRYK